MKLEAEYFTHAMATMMDEMGLPECHQHTAEACTNLCQSKLADGKSWAEASKSKDWRRFRKMHGMKPKAERLFAERASELYESLRE